MIAIGNPPLTMQSLQYFVIAKIIIFNFISATTYTHIYVSYQTLLQVQNLYFHCECCLECIKIMQHYTCNILIFCRPKLLLHKIKYLKNRCSYKHNFFTEFVITQQATFLII